MDKPIMRLTGTFRDVSPPTQGNRMLLEGEHSPTQLVDWASETHQCHAIRLNWQRNDLLLLDGMLYSHGRDSFGGNHQVLIDIARSIDVSNTECQK